MAVPGQQFGDWNSIDTSQPGILGGLAAMGVQKSGLQDFLNTQLPSGMQMVQGKMQYGVPPPTAPTGVPPVAPTVAAPAAPEIVPANQQQPLEDDYHPDAVKALNISAWDGPEFGSGGQDKMKMLASFFG